MAVRKRHFFAQPTRAEDDEARQRDVAALLAPRHVVVQDIAVNRIVPNPFQARQTFDNLDELAASIRALGFTTRLRVRPHPNETGQFELVFGERRLRAARLAQMETVPCEVATHTDNELLEIGLAENIQRRDLNPLEEAHAFRQFIDQRNYTIRRLAERIGKDKSYIDSRLALLRLPDDVQTMVAQRSDTIRAAREIAKLATLEERRPLIDAMLNNMLSKDDIRAIVAVAHTTASPTLIHPAHETAISTSTAQVHSDNQPLPNTPNTPNTAIHPETTNVQPPVLSNAHSTSPPHDRDTSVQRTLVRDVHTIRSVLARWRTMLHDDRIDTMLIIAAITELTTDVHTLTSEVELQHTPEKRT